MMGTEWKIDSEGKLSAADFLESPNHDNRPSNTDVELLVIHCISLPIGKYGNGYIDKLFMNELDEQGDPQFSQIIDLRVSAHFLINRKGNITQYVSCLNRAWHAGKSRWRNRHECNDFSIGIELEGTDTTRFTEKQYFNLAKLTKVLKRKFAIREIVSHSEIALPIGRKSDPGDLFEWDKYKKLIE